MAARDPHLPCQPGSAAVSRREFVKTTVAAGAGVMIVPRHVLGQGRTPPSDLVNIATVGFFGMGASNTQALLSQNIVAICDVDDALVDQRLAAWRNIASPVPGAGRGRGAGPGGGGAPQPQPFRNTFTDFGRSKAQEAANTKWTPEPTPAAMKRFIDQQLPRLKRYRDYRQMLEQQKDIDGLVIATPDHMHAPIAMAAMDLGKHVYVQKPMCWSVAECRALAKKAAEKKVVTQMGNQGHSQDDARRGQEYLMSGAIGDVREVHVWTNRPLSHWPQGVPRPAQLAADPATLSWSYVNLMRRLSGAISGPYRAPDTLSWDLFLGVAPYVEYHPVYHPFNWRGWVDWGQGALGDMGAHLIDHPVWGLKLGLPTTIETISTPYNGATYPAAAMTHYEFPARGAMPPVKLVWYDGGFMPPRPEELGEEKLIAEGGVLYIGSKGKMLQNTYGARPRLLPVSLHNAFGAPPERLVRIPHQSHEMNWVNAVKGHEEASCPFSYAAHLNEIMLLGVASLRANTKIHYDGANMRITNSVAANEYLAREYRAGFSI
jgi:predicted dehydrogenase